MSYYMESRVSLHHVPYDVSIDVMKSAILKISNDDIVASRGKKSFVE